MATVAPISCNYKNENEIYLAFMPFIKGGGLFVRTKAAYELGDSVSLSVQLLNEPDSYVIEGKVVWLTPKGAQGNKPIGIGIQFIGENSRHFCNKIETLLAGMLKSTQNTDTI